ncbi:MULTISPECIES: aminotransferase class V-fold PLP-dependent enzyme [unclassified Streptomyces]|uniref:aminotransferase class V-fold PLP-dependent enzyme n=1 Tax=unclassified Streptomyces TaxID=2593676 RepID=UPI0035D73D76
MAHLSNFYLASNPTPVRDAITKYRKAFDEDPHSFLDDNMFGREEDKLWRTVCAEAAEYVGGHADEIALTTSTTMGLALTYNGLRLKPGQEILTTTHEFYPHHETIRLTAERWGATMRAISLYESSPDFSVDEAVARIRAAIRPHTRVFGVAWVHSNTGVRLPISRVADVIADLNRNRDEEDRVLLVVDGVHGFGVADEDVVSMGWHRLNWKRASMAGALGYHAADPNRGARLRFHLKPGSYDTAGLIEVLQQVKTFYRGERVVLVRDGLSAHWSRAMRAWVAEQDWLILERLPAYAPELNPVELLWSLLKKRELVNLAGDHLADVADATEQGIRRINDNPKLPWSFLTHTGLIIYPPAPPN